MRRNLCLAGFLVLIMLLSVIPAIAEQPAGKQLSASEIKKTISGNTTRFISKRGNRFVTFWKESGTMLGMSESASAKKTVSGSWNITEDGQLCSNWSNSKWESGCRRLFLDEKTGEIQFYNMEGTPVMKVTEILPGNPDNLY